MSIALAVAYCLFCSFVWRLRGGAWATLLNIHMGTTVTRLVSAALISLPLALWTGNLILIPLITVGLWLGLVMAGYGPYMGMGDHAITPAPTWINFFPRLFGFEPYSIKWDFAGMWFCGLLLSMFVVAGYVWLDHHWWSLLWIPLSGFGFAGIYLLASKVPDHLWPVWPGFTAKEHEVFGELGYGLFVGAMLLSLTNSL